MAEPDTGGEYVSVIPRGKMGAGGSGGVNINGNIVIQANTYEGGQAAAEGFWTKLKDLGRTSRRI